jgi:DNA replication protein DnaC
MKTSSVSVTHRPRRNARPASLRNATADSSNTAWDAVLKSTKRLGWSAAAEALRVQVAANDGRPFLERFQDLVAAEQRRRADNALARRLCAAQLPEIQAVLADAWLDPERGFTEYNVAYWSAARWVGKGSNLLITGRSGCGRTWLACAIAHAAMSRGYYARYWSVPNLLEAWYHAEEFSTVPEMAEALLRPDVLVLDLWGCEPIDDSDAVSLRRALEPRLQHKRSILVSSNLSPKDWPGWLGGSDLAESLARQLVALSEWVDLRPADPRLHSNPLTAEDKGDPEDLADEPLRRPLPRRKRSRVAA